MKRFAVVGKNRKQAAALIRKMQKLGFVFDRKKPEFVVSLGGDGTFLHSERLYPGVPKLLSRDSAICQKCGNMLLGAVLERIKAGRFRVREFRKVEAVIGKKKLLAANDIIIRNKFPGHAIRFTAAVNGRKVNGMLIGDGIVVASAFGSTGYFRSITGKSFASGMGIAFNNLTTRRKAQMAKGVVFSLQRGTAVVAADNDPGYVVLKDRGVVSIKQSSQLFRVVSL